MQKENSKVKHARETKFTKTADFDKIILLCLIVNRN